MMSHLTSCTQTSFIPGRQITDNIVIVQEVIHTMKTKQGKTGYMAIKIDFEKAYDRLKWKFIQETLAEVRFPQLLISVIMECITTPSMRILWNGEPTESFSPSRGIRQGDPLSPYIFVLCMERLNQVIEEAIIMNKWKPIRASRTGPQLSNLCFADDIILFGEATVEQALVIHQCLQRFCGASGSKISFDKSRVFFSNNMSWEAQQEVSEALCIEPTDDLGMYLGMPTLTSRVTKDTFGYLCEKIDRRLAGWKTKYLSLAGRVTLAKSTVSTIASYAMQTAKIPKNTCDKIDQKTRRFIWGGNEDTKRIHLISWERLQSPLNQGGLGCRSSRQVNAAFLTKLEWRVLTEPNALWSRVLRNKYCKCRCDLDMFAPKTNMSNVWKGITENVNTLRNGARVAVNTGTSTLFWDHCWASNQPLRELTVQAIPQDIEGATVAELWDKDVGWHWDLFATLLPSNVLKEIDAFELKENAVVGDLYYWPGSAKGKFTIKSALKLIRRETLEPNDGCNPPHF